MQALNFISQINNIINLIAAVIVFSALFANYDQSNFHNLIMKWGELLKYINHAITYSLNVLEKKFMGTKPEKLKKARIHLAIIKSFAEEIEAKLIALKKKVFG